MKCFILIVTLLTANLLAGNDMKKYQYYWTSIDVDYVKENIFFEETKSSEIVKRLKTQFNDFFRIKDSSTKSKIYINVNYRIKRDKEFFKALVMLHNNILSLNDEHLYGSPYEILHFIVKYTIYHRDKYLINEILHNDILLRGDGSYSQDFYEQVYLPLLLFFDGIDTFLSERDIEVHSNMIVFNGFERPKKFFYSYYFKDDIDVHLPYADFYEIIKKQSQRLAKSIERLYGEIE